MSSVQSEGNFWQFRLEPGQLLGKMFALVAKGGYKAEGYAGSLLG